MITIIVDDCQTRTRASCILYMYMIAVAFGVDRCCEAIVRAYTNNIDLYQWIGSVRHSNIITERKTRLLTIFHATLSIFHNDTMSVVCRDDYIRNYVAPIYYTRLYSSTSAPPFDDRIRRALSGTSEYQFAVARNKPSWPRSCEYTHCLRCTPVQPYV